MANQKVASRGNSGGFTNTPSIIAQQRSTRADDKPFEVKAMKRSFHGVFSLVLILAAVVTALIYIFGVSMAWGLVYVGAIVLANPMALYAYCAKCACREFDCSHIFPGKLAGLLPPRAQGPYTGVDYLGTALSLIVLLGVPQFWIWRNKAVFIAYWIPILLGLVEIRFWVCRDCRNENCPMNGSRSGPAEPVRKV